MNQGFRLMLGTAQWGWNLSETTAFTLLENWIQCGYRAIDTATNYPINRIPADFRAAENMLAHFCKSNPREKLEVTVKIGSMNNMRGPEINLNPSFIRMMGEEYLHLFGENLHTVMIHWDNREQESEIRASLEALFSLYQDFGLNIGLSGIAHPSVYARALEDLPILCDIQLKHNVIQSDLDRYAPLAAQKHHLYAYGINAGGIKLNADYHAESTFTVRGGDPERSAIGLKMIQDKLPQWNTANVRPPVCTMNHLGLIFAAMNPNIRGLVLGASSEAQIQESIGYIKNIEVFDYQDIWNDLVRIASNNS